MKTSAANDIGGIQSKIHLFGCNTFLKIIFVRSTAYFSLISFASSMISKAYFCFPFASIFL